MRTGLRQRKMVNPMISERLQKSQEIVRKEYYPHFEWIENDSCPWQPPAQSLSEGTLAYITSCGLYRNDSHLPFSAYNNFGDPTFREIHVDTPADLLRIGHTHANNENAEKDMRILFPVEHLLKLEAEQIVGKVYSWVYSYMGFMPEPTQFLAETAPVLTRRLKNDGVTAVLLTPC